jgi:LPXTG-motif cell wall-anchored protein
MKWKLMNIILAALLVFFLMQGIATGTGGFRAYKIEGNNNGLVARSLDPPANIGNLNPGDSKCSRLQLANTGSSMLKVYIRTDITGEKTLKGSGSLADVLWLTIMDGNNKITDSSFRNADKAGNVYIGTMPAGTKKILEFCATFPGEEAGNEYQGASMNVRWIITTATTGSHDPAYPPNEPSDPEGPFTPPPEEPDIDEPSPEEPDIDIDDEPVPTGPEDEITPVDDEEIPIAPEDLPKTGGVHPIYFYGAGALVAVIGIILRRKQSRIQL